MSSEFTQAWINWANEERPTVRLPNESVDELAATLMALRVVIHDGTLRQGYSGPLVNAAIRAWHCPRSQRRISRAALEFLENGGAARQLVIEHNPPIAFFRDLVRDKEKDLSVEVLSGYLQQLRVTRVLRVEDGELTKRGFKSRRPPDAYRECGIEELEDRLQA